MKTTKPVLLIDFYKTLCYGKFWKNSPKRVKFRIFKLLSKESMEMFDEWMRGKYTSEEINQYISEKTRVDSNYLWKNFVNTCKTMRIRKDVLKMLTKLRSKYTIILMTDNMDSLNRFTIPSLKLDQYFDYISNSYDHGLLKQDNNGEIFHKILKQHACPFNKAFLFDDNKKTCQLFKSLGGNAYHVSRLRKLQYYLRKFLQRKNTK